jgi:hypothetical protein
LTPFPLYDDIIVLVDGCHATGDGALHINSVGHETSPPWPSTLVLDDEDDVFVGEDGESESADKKVVCTSTCLLHCLTQIYTSLHLFCTLHVFQNVDVLLQYHQLQPESIKNVPMQS